MNASRLRNLWSIMPDRATLGYQVQPSLGVYAAAVPVNDCWWRPAQTDELLPSFGVAVRSLRTWFIPKTKTTIVPAIGDLITNAVTAIDPVVYPWVVTGLQDVGALGTWRLDSISLSLQANLRGSLTFSRPDDAVDSSYRPFPIYTEYATAIPSRVQPEDGSAVEVFDRITLPSKFTAVLGVRVAVRAKDRAVDDNGNTYTILSSEMPERLDEMQRLALEVIL
ncbi:MAG TPA: hypothetical protein VN641_18705 [Urbifossiella sp.]|nr:hypothetical protein [Urbifossiella sp.]